MTTTDKITKGSWITGPARDKVSVDLKTKYEKGASIRALAEATGRSYGFVHRILSEAGAQLRARGGNTRTTTLVGRHGQPTSPKSKAAR